MRLRGGEFVPSIGPEHLRPLSEFKYLNAENVSRYRLIMRIFYENHMRLRYWLRPLDVHGAVLETGLIPGYTVEQCEQDLQVLHEWGNLECQQDKAKSTSIEEFKKKRFRYQMTAVAVEIERLLNALEQVQGYGGELDATPLETIARILRDIRERAQEMSRAESFAVWKELMDRFRRLHENAVDYYAQISSAKAEALMQTEAFLAFKEDLRRYLQQFALGLQQFGAQIEGTLRALSSDVVEAFLSSVTWGEMEIPNLEDRREFDERMVAHREEWRSLEGWFIGLDGDDSEVVKLERATKEAIGRVVRQALALQEQARAGVSRRRDLSYLARWFMSLDSIAEAHRLGAAVFGLYVPRHFQGEPPRSTDSADCSMWDEAPVFRALSPKTRGPRQRLAVSPVRDRAVQKAKATEAWHQAQANARDVERRWLREGTFSMAEFDELTVEDRGLLLQWVSRALSRADRRFRSPEGYQIRVEIPEHGERHCIVFSDGEMEMPNFKFYIWREHR
ncbi:TIGR02677 family protein [Alicyclobacillus vulcanalis]|uniref:TIGR02677 family protein n=2 Tax=Alicyclobacillus TaxID=29330 RepID=A0A1N7NYE2_9BACL|nr:TIGR02677 family protein [Alicyclobacillus vulcanalis]